MHIFDTDKLPSVLDFVSLGVMRRPACLPLFLDGLSRRSVMLTELYGISHRRRTNASKAGRREAQR